MDFFRIFFVVLFSPLITWFIYYLLRPKKQVGTYVQPYDFDAMFKKYKKQDSKGTLLFMFVWVLFSVLLGYIVNKGYLYFLANDQYTFFSPLSAAPFYAASFGVAIIPASFIYYKFLQAKRGFDWQEFKFYYQNRYKMDFDKGRKYIGGSMFILGSLALVLGVNTYSYKTAEEFVFNPFLGLEQSYNCSDIDKVVYYETIEAPNGDIKEEESYRIFFKDGRCWFTRTNGYSEDDDFDFVEDFAEECGVEILEEESTGAY